MSKDLKASLLQNYRKIARPHLITKHSMTKKQTSTEINGIRRRRIPNPKPLKHFVKKREHTPPPSEISCGADNSGAKVRKNWLPKARLSQSRSLGFLVWCGRTRLSLARTSRSKARLVSKSSQKPINKQTKLAIK